MCRANSPVQPLKHIGQRTVFENGCANVYLEEDWLQRLQRRGKRERDRLCFSWHGSKVSFLGSESLVTIWKGALSSLAFGSVVGLDFQEGILGDL
jgi:hypothetical protein